MRGTKINLTFSNKAQTVGREGKSWLRVESVSFGELEEKILNKCLHHFCSCLCDILVFFMKFLISKEQRATNENKCSCILSLY